MLSNPLTRSVHYRRGIPILPGHFPVVGHLPSFYATAAELFQGGADQLGPLYWINMGFGSGWNLACTGPAGFELLKNKVTTNAHIAERATLLIGEHGLLAVDGGTHQRMRSILNPPFTPRGLGQSGIGAALASLTEKRVQRWAAASPGRSKIDILREVQELALDIVFRIVEVEGEEVSEWRKQYRRFLLSMIPVPIELPGFPLYYARRARRWLDQSLVRILDRSRQSVASSALVGEMVSARDEQGQPLSNEELIDNLRLLMLAGHETTASTLAFLVINLAQRTDLWNSLCEEVRNKPQLPLTPQEARAFPFAEALFRETLRVHPPVALTSRRTTQLVQLAGHTIPAGDIVFVPIIQISGDPTLYPNPQRFDPTRWLGRGAPSPIETVQFGGGPHFCMGYHLALFEAIQFIVALALHLGQHGLRPRLADGPAPKPIYLPLTHPTPGTQIEFVRS